MPEREGTYVIYAEPKDIKKGQDLVNKVNGVNKEVKYCNYLEAREGVLTFILN